MMLSFFAAFLAASAMAGETWTMAKKPNVWAHDKGALRLEVLPVGGYEVRHTGPAD